jgi:hypothetical protein
MAAVFPANQARQQVSGAHRGPTNHILGMTGRPTNQPPLGCSLNWRSNYGNMHLNLQPQMSLQIYGDVTQVKSIHHISMKQISIKHQISSNMHINILWVIPSLYYIILYFIIPCVIPWYSHGFLSSHAHHLRHPPQVIVVGGGLAGMSAANTVVEHGGRTLLLDKSSFCGGNSTKARR